MNFKGFAVIAFSFANFAGNEDVRKEMHFDFDDSVAFTGFASSSADIEGISSCVISPCFGFGGFGKKISDIGENSGICCGV